MHATTGELAIHADTLPLNIPIPQMTVPPLPVLLIVGAGALVLLLALLFALHVAGTMRLLDLSSREGRRISAELHTTHPLTNFTRNGKPSDPINLRIVATESQLATAFVAAGWYRADEIRLITALRISVSAILGAKYSTAPVSNLYLFGRPQDIAFQRPGSNVRMRDHVRFWESGEHSRDGRPIWVGAATEDVDVEISPTTHLPTHKIGADVDEERALVVRDLVATGWVINRAWATGFGEETHLKNASGDEYFTDGKIAVLTLANVPVLLPFPTQVRGEWVSHFSQAAVNAFRWTLPKLGRKHAREQEQQEQQTQQEQVATRATPARTRHETRNLE
ncbi:MAG TPA: LssY C-terminal domain-containing protein [Ktedonobacterales bacterium]